MLASKVQVGVRFDRLTWNRYRALCRTEAVVPNNLLQEAMTAALEAGSVRVVAERLANSGPREVAESALFKQGLSRIDGLVDQGYSEYFLCESHNPASGPRPTLPDKARKIYRVIDQLLKLRPEVRDAGLLEQSDRTVERAFAYVQDAECETPREAQSAFTRQAREEYGKGKIRPGEDRSVPA